MEPDATEQEAVDYQSEASYLATITSQVLFPPGIPTATVGERLRQLGTEGYVQRFRRELKKDGYKDWQIGGVLESQRRWAETILGIGKQK